MRAFVIASFTFLFCLEACAETSFETVPWTKSFLETTASFFVDRVSTRKSEKSSFHHSKSVTEPCLLFSSAVLPDWQFDIALAGKQCDEGKLAFRAEKLLFSDLQRSSCALSCFFNFTEAQKKRVKNPIYFEMAQHAAEGGIGLGKHLYVGKTAYTQAFSYLLGGKGKSSLWTGFEVGLCHSFQNHSFRYSLSHIKSLGHHQEFLGYGAIASQQNIHALQYTFRMIRGDFFIRYARRSLKNRCIDSSQSLRVGISFSLHT